MTNRIEKFANELEPGMVYLIKDKEVSETIFHYFVIINRDIKTSPVLVLPVATSQIEKRIKYYEKYNLNKETLVIVEPEESNGILTKRSAFDCEQIKTREIQDLYFSFIKRECKYVGKLPLVIIDKLRKGVITAKGVDKWIKELL